MRKTKISLLVITIIYFFVGCKENLKHDAWHLNNMAIDSLWKKSKGTSQIIAFIDTGLSEEYYNLLGNRIIDPVNIIDESSSFFDLHGHGTEMISLACGNGEFANYYGIATEAKIMPIKAIGEEGSFNNEILYKGIKYAIDNSATIINLSVGGYTYDKSVDLIVQEALSKNITIIASAGDDGNRDLLFPANIKGVISVEALDENHEKWDMTNTHEDSTVVFPGVDIEVLSFRNKLEKVHGTGTSQATAIISGYVALLKDYNNPNNDELLVMLKSLNSKSGKRINYYKPFEK